MAGHIKHTVSSCHRHENLQKAFSIFLLGSILVACSSGVSQTMPLTSITSTPSISSSTTEPSVSSVRVKPTSVEEIYPTYTPAPTSTALPTLQPAQPLVLKSLHMMDEQNGWGIDTSEHIIHTIDGGWTWKDVTPRNGAYRDSGFFALDVNTAWATPYQADCFTVNCPPRANNASVWHTTDGGNTWQEQHVCLQGQECNFSFDTGTNFYYPIALQFVNSKHGWLLIVVEHVMFQDRYRLYQTMDGGIHWSPEMDNIMGPWTMSATGLAFQDQQTGWFATSQIGGATDPLADWSMYRSTDAGQTWNEAKLPEPNPLPKAFAGNTAWCGAYGVEIRPPNALGVIFHCIVYADPLSAYDFYFHSPDGGMTWNSWLKTGDVDFITATIGWRSTINNGGYDLEQTHDGGQTWTRIKTVQWNGDFDFINEQVGWAIATNGDTVALVHTTDGGKTWEEIQPVVAGN